MSRRTVMAIIGSASATPDVLAEAEALGRAAVDAGFRVVTGGLRGVMLAASRGARSSERWTEGTVVGVLPSYDRSTANEFVDIVVPTGLQLARNVVVVAMADVVVAVNGGSGTLSEIALGWQLGRPIVALTTSGGWAEEMAGRVLDERHAQPVAEATSVADAVAEALRLVEMSRPETGDVGSGWRTRT